MREELEREFEWAEGVKRDFIGTGRAGLAADRYRVAFGELVRFDLEEQWPG